METFKVYIAAIIGTIVMIAGPFVAAFAVASFAPILAAPTLGIGLVAFPVLGCHLVDVIAS
jgi:hypothetical protein